MKPAPIPRTRRMPRSPVVSPAGLAVWLAAGLALGLAAGCGGSTDRDHHHQDHPAGSEATMDPGELTTLTDAWHAERLERLRAPDGWLSLVGLEALPAAGEATVGSAVGADVVLRADVPPRVGVFHVGADGVRFRPDAGVDVQAGEPPAPVPAGGLDLRDDLAGPPTVLTLGSASWYVITRGDRRFVRVKDRASPVRRDFVGIPRWPVDPAWRVTARLVREGAPRTIAVPNALGQVDHEPCPGILEFTLAGEPCRLLPMGEPDGPLFLVFGDATSGRTSYGGGRFLATEAPDADGTVVLDFNRAINPPCVFTPYATCPLPPEGNVLPVAVTAGEQVPGEGH